MTADIAAPKVANGMPNEKREVRNEAIGNGSWPERWQSQPWLFAVFSVPYFLVVAKATTWHTQQRRSTTGVVAFLSMSSLLSALQCATAMSGCTNRRPSC